MNARILNAFAVLCLLALVGIMSWRDMHPRHDTRYDVSSVQVTGYYAGPDITSAMIPGDNKPLTVDAGDFNYTPEGEMIWSPHGMPPTLFAQRQINLQFNFKNLPQDPEKTIEKIQSIADDWTRKGDTVAIFVLNYSPAKVDFKGYTALLRAAHIKFDRTASENRHAIFATIDSSWGGEALKDLRDYSPRFVINLPQASISPELFAKLAALKYDFVLQYPSGVQIGDIDRGALKKLNALNGISLTLDARRPLPKNEETIGLFPKF